MRLTDTTQIPFGLRFPITATATMLTPRYEPMQSIILVQCRYFIKLSINMLNIDIKHKGFANIGTINLGPFLYFFFTII